MSEKNGEKIVVLQMILEKKDVLFGNFSPTLTHAIQKAAGVEDDEDEQAGLGGGRQAAEDRLEALVRTFR